MASSKETKTPQCSVMTSSKEIQTPLPLCICSQTEFFQYEMCEQCKFTLPSNIALLQNPSLFSPPTYFAGLERKKEIESLKNELQILIETPTNQNVVRYFSPFIRLDKKRFVVIVIELCDGNLQNYIDDDKIHPLTSIMTDEPIKCKSAQSYYPVSDEFDLLYQIVKGLKHLHANNIIHCKIHPEKILLVRKNGKTVAKIGGFKHSMRQSKPVESSSFIPGECKEYWSGDKSFSKASDVYALGVLMYNTLTKGEYPFQEWNDTNNILRQHRNSRELCFEGLRKRQEECKTREKDKKDRRKKERNEVNRAKNIKFAENTKQKTDAAIAEGTEEKWATTIDMIKRMLNDDPDKRLTIEQVSHHPTFYTDQKKIDFLLKVNRSLHKMKLSCDFCTEACSYSLSLCNDHPTSTKTERFEIDYRSLFDPADKFYYFLEDYPKVDPNEEKSQKIIWKSLEGVCNVQALLKALRNKVAHANDWDEFLPVDFRKDFQIGKDSYNSTLFLKVFLADTPHLLVHLYELFRNESRAIEFYTDVA